MRAKPASGAIEDQQTSFKAVALLSASHVVNDSYMNMFPPLLPFLVPNFGLTISSIGWLTALFSVTSSLSQLAIGYLVDRYGGRYFIFLGPPTAAVSMSAIGLVHNYALLASLVSMAGLGVAAFHPPASAIAGSVAGDKSGRAMSLFTLGGNLGWAVMPVIAVLLVSNYGLQSTPLLAIPGIIAAMLLFKFAPSLPASASRGFAFLDIIKSQPKIFFCLLGSVAFRSLAFFSLIAFLPKLLTARGFSVIDTGILLCLLTFSGAFGGLIGGFLSDSYGRRPIIMGSLFLAVPLMLLFQFSSKTFMPLWLALAGASLLASFSVTVVAAQEIFPENKAIASSFALGFGLGLGGLGVGILGQLASFIGLYNTFFVISLLPLAAMGFSYGLPRSRQNHKKVNIKKNEVVRNVISNG